MEHNKNKKLSKRAKIAIAASYILFNPWAIEAVLNHFNSRNLEELEKIVEIVEPAPIVSMENNVKKSNPLENKNSVENKEFSYLEEYNAIIDKYVAEFNSKHNFPNALDPDLIRAMIITESGSPADRNTAFIFDPMQIANQGDFALETLANQKEHTYLIGNFDKLKRKKKTPWKNGKLYYLNSNMNADSSIYAGISWLTHKAAIYDTKLVEFGEMQKYFVEKGDSFWRIAKKNKTTIETLKKYNPNINPKKLRVGEKLKYKEAEIKLYIKAWREWQNAVERYNGRGDPNYVKKVYTNYDRLKNKVNQAENYWIKN